MHPISITQTCNEKLAFHPPPFGMQIESRSYTSGDKGYRFAFNGKEKDVEGMGGGGATYDYGFRIYNGQLGKFLSLDPLFKEFPWNSPYAFSENSPIAFIDLEGLERYYAADGRYIGKVGTDKSIRIINPATMEQSFEALQAMAGIADGGMKVPGLEELSVEYEHTLRMSSHRSYASMNDAANQFGLRYGSISIIRDKEYFAKIGSVTFTEEGKDKNGKITKVERTVYILGSVSIGDPHAGYVNPDKSELFGTTLAGGTHTHGKDPSGRRSPKTLGGHCNDFSGLALPSYMTLGKPGDMDWAKENKVPIYAAVPNGDLKIFIYSGPYKEGDEKGRIINSNMPYDPETHTREYKPGAIDRPAHNAKQDGNWISSSEEIDYSDGEL